MVGCVRGRKPEGVAVKGACDYGCRIRISVVRIKFSNLVLELMKK